MNASLAGVVFYGAYLKDEGEITIGNITGFLLYMMQLLMNFFIISVVFGNVFKVLGASGKMIAMMRTKCEVNSRGGKLIP